MQEITINNDNLSYSEINTTGKKSRAILIANNKILIANYGGVYLFPGGSIDIGENCDKAITRELEEEIGIKYEAGELNKICCLNYYQKDYPTRSNETLNRLISTYYYIGKYKGIDLNHSQRTEKEIQSGFKLELLTPKEIEQHLHCNDSANPRKKYFDNEAIEILKYIKTIDIENKFREKTYVKNKTKSIKNII